MSGGRTLSVLVADLVESTRLNIELGPDRADEVRRIIFSRFDEAIAAHNGTLVKTMGDGCLVTYPSASESVGSGIDMIGAINRLSHQVPGLKLRVAVAVGDVTAEGGDVFGEPVIVATRLCAAASPGQVLTTDLVRELAGGRGGFEWERVGGLFLKGIDEPVACSAARPPADGDARLRLPRPLRARTAELFVGRVDAVDTLVRSWKDASTGERRAVVVSGEPGVGKSRLVASVTRQADDDGALILYGRCEEDLAVPYQPFADALRNAVQSAPRDLIAAHVAVHGGALRRLFPKLMAPEPPEAAPEAEQLRIIAALTDLLDRLCEEQPVVLVIEDIHWAAPATVRALRHLINVEDPAAFLLLATYRDTEVDRHHALGGLLADLSKIEGAQRIALNGLDRGEIEELVEQASGEPLNDDGRRLADALFDRTAGNPFFANQVLRHMAEAGALVYRDGQWESSGALNDLPGGVLDVVTRRLARLDRTTNDMLAVAAVCGEAFSYALIGRAAQVERAGVGIAAAIDEAVTARLLTEDGRGGYGFAHAIVRDVLLDSMTAAAKARIHQNIANALRSLHGDGLSAPLYDLAYHACGAAILGDGTDAARYSIAAAEACIHRADVPAAIDILTRGWNAIELVEPLDHKARFGVCSLLAELHYQSLDGVVDALEAAAASARALQSPERLARLSLHAYRWNVVESDFAMGLVNDALAMLPPGPSELRALALASGAYLMNMHLAGRPREWTRDAFAMVDELGGPKTKDLRLAWEYAVMSTSGQPGARDVVSRIEAVDGTPYSPGAGYKGAGFLGTKAELYLRIANRAAAEATLHTMEAVAGTSGDPTMEGWAITTKVIWALLEARYDEALPLMEQAVRRIGVHVPNIEATVAVGSMWLAYEQGRSADIVDGLRTLHQMANAPGITAAFAVHLCEAGLFDEAREVLTELMRQLPSMGRPVTFGCTIALMATVCAHLDAAEAAQSLLDELEPFRGEIMGLPANVMQGATDRFRGPLLALVGKREEGIEALRAAIALETGLGAKALVVRSQYWLDRVIADAG
jgi:class 3 adenylate cyclase